MSTDKASQISAMLDYYADWPCDIPPQETDEEYKNRIEKNAVLKREQTLKKILSTIPKKPRPSSEQPSNLDLGIWIEAISSGNNIYINRTIAKKTSLEEAAILSYFFQKGRSKIQNFKWIKFQCDKIKHWTSLTDYQIRAILNKWICMRILYKIRTGQPPTLWLIFNPFELNIYLCKIFECTQAYGGEYPLEADGKIRQRKIKTTIKKNKKPQYGEEWTSELRRKIKKRDNYECQNDTAMKHVSVLSVHHIDYNKKNNKRKNLITLCRTCHARTNGNRENWTEYFQDMMNKRFPGNKGGNGK